MEFTNGLVKALPLLVSRSFLITFLVIVGQSLSPVTADSDAKSILDCQRLSLKTGDLSSEAVSIAMQIKKCSLLTLEIVVKWRLEVLKRSLPSSVTNAVFFKNLCIKNKHFSEYMYAPVSGYKYDGERRRVFTWGGAPWDHEKGDFHLLPASENHFYIVSANNNEYLFAAGDSNVVDHRRRVFMWEPQEWDHINERLAEWELKPAGDEGRVYIKNRQYQEHLYAVYGANYDAQRRTVETWEKRDNGCVGDAQCMWEITPCGEQPPC